MSKENKTILITGASSDLGLNFIKRNHRRYDKILAHYNSTNVKLNDLNEAASGKIIPLQADFMSEESTYALVDTIKKMNICPDHILHLPAPLLDNVKFEKTDWSMFEKELSIGFRSAVIISQGFVKQMCKQKYGKIVFMLSFNVVNQPPIKYAIPYTSVKYAMLGLMKGLAAEYADKGVTVNGVSPSMIDTKFLSGVPQLLIEKNATESPLKRNLSVDEVMPACEFLFSDDADCITGQNIPVTGGR